MVPLLFAQVGAGGRKPAGREMRRARPSQPLVAVQHVEAVLHASDNTTIRGSALGVRLRRAQTTKALAWDGIALVGALSVTGTAGEITRISLCAIGRWY